MEVDKAYTRWTGYGHSEIRVSQENRCHRGRVYLCCLEGGFWGANYLEKIGATVSDEKSNIRAL